MCNFRLIQVDHIYKKKLLDLIINHIINILYEWGVHGMHQLHCFEFVDLKTTMYTLNIVIA